MDDPILSVHELINRDMKDMYLGMMRRQNEAWLWSILYKCPPPPPHDSIFNKENPLMSTDKLKATFAKDKLLEKLKENKYKHVANFKEAQKKYRAKAIEALHKRTAEMETRHLDGLPRLDFNLPIPISYEKDYDRIIGMLEMHVEDNIELGMDQYRKFVEDDWDWKRQFEISTLSYVED